MDIAALDELGRERIGWRHKGFPARFEGMTVAEVAAARPRLDELATPLLYLGAAELTHNIDVMARYTRDSGVDLAPHGKTTMAPQLFRRQLDAGSWGITAATIAHVRAYRAFGVPTVLLGNQLLDPDGLAWVAAELDRDPGFRFLCFVDSVRGAELMRDALAGRGSRPLDVVIDVGGEHARTGVRTVETGVEVAAAVHAAAGLRLVGVGGFEGAIGKDRSDAEVAKVRGFLEKARTLAQTVDAAGLFADADEIILTAGGSAYFTEVVEVFQAEWPVPASKPLRTVLRSGAYISHDHGHYTHITPFTAERPGPGPFLPALHLRGRVLSRPEPGLALLDFGKRDAPFDIGTPIPLWWNRAGADGTGEGEPQTTGLRTVASLADQHAFLHLDEDAPGPAVGDVVTCGISHPCTAFDKWQLFPVADDSRVVDIIRTHF